MVEIGSPGEEAGGGTRKYYKSNTRMFSYDLPEGRDQTLSAAQEHTTEELRTLLESPMRLMGTTSSWLPKK